MKGYGGCKCKANIILSLNWGKPGGTLSACSKHAPSWVAGKKVGEGSPVVSLFGETKSFYTVKQIL